MSSPKIDTFTTITPLIYAWDTPDIPKYEGWEKIGYTEQADAETRIAQQASQLAVEKRKLWSRRAFYHSEAGGAFRDSDFHAYLRQQGVERELTPRRTEWHHLAPAPKTSLEYFNDFAGQDHPVSWDSRDQYELRPEQQAAVDQAVAVFEAGEAEMLWNAKPRFGKTLTVYDLMLTMDVRKVLIVTNRPAIANSWFDDFQQFIGHQSTFRFVSESPSLSSRAPMTRQQWCDYSLNHQEEDPQIIEFLSLQDLKGSQYFGGPHNKLKHIADFDWDMLVIDEAHEGVDTTKTDVAFDQIKRQWTLHLSGTPFKALAAGKFHREQIYNWTYEDEQTARQNWNDESQENPYLRLPTLNLLTYQLSRMITDRLSEGVAVEGEDANIDYAFSLNEFFATKENGYFEHEVEIIRFLDAMATNEKYPFSTSELREEIRHSFWLLNRVASAKALARLLKKHPVFQDYDIVLAAGDGRSEDDGDLAAVSKSLDKVRTAIAQAEKSGGRTITLSVGQLTTGVTVPEWTAVIMLSDMTSPAQYMQAAFRAQNPHVFERAGEVFQKHNAYIFDFAPERTLTIFDAFANNLHFNSSRDPAVRQQNVRTLLNFFPVLGEDDEGRMIELDASQVLTFPQVFKAREVVRRGFLSNLLFTNVAGIFRHAEHYKQILDKLPTVKQGKFTTKTKVDLPDDLPTTDLEGEAQVDIETVISPKVEQLGKPVYREEDIPAIAPDEPAGAAASKIAKAVTDRARSKREELKKEYGLTAAQVERDEKRTEQTVRAAVERAQAEHTIAAKHLEAELAEAATEAEAETIETRKAAHEDDFRASILAIVDETMDSIVPDVVTREETKTEQKRVDKAMDDVRSRLRGFARTIPMFLMAYGDRGLTLANFDDYTPDDVFEEITGITEAEFRLLRDGQEIAEEDGTTTAIPGMFDALVFDQSVQEFLDKKAALADYFDESQTETIFAYVPPQKTSLVFTPETVVKQMVDVLESENPGIFGDPDKKFADLVSTAGVFIMELVRRLDSGLADRFPDQEERLRHILTSQVFKVSQNEILHRVTIESVSGGVPQRKAWIEESGHFRVGSIARMNPEQRQQLANDMLSGGA